MAKRSRKNNNKTGKSNASRMQYQQKQEAYWTCQVCTSVHSLAEPYCMHCYQELCYYGIVNNELFVVNDEAYISMYQDKETVEAKSVRSNSTTADSDCE